MPSGSSVICSNALAGNRTQASTFAESRANPTHSKDNLIQYPAEESGHRPIGWSPSDRFEVCHAVHHTRRAFKSKSRRPDSHQHQPVYKTGAFLSRATSASSTSARSRTPFASFGGWLLSQEHTRVKQLSVESEELRARQGIAVNRFTLNFQLSTLNSSLTSPARRSSTPR